MKAVRTAAVVTALIVAAGASASGSTSRASHVSTGPGLGFRNAAGWHVIQNGLSEAGALSVATAANVPIAPADRPPESAPTHTVESLPRDAVGIWVQFEPRRHSAKSNKYFPPRTLPLRLSGSARLHGTPEGFACPRTCAIRTLEASAAGYDIGIFIFFGRSSATVGMRTRADRELGRLSLPPCPIAEPLGHGDLSRAAGLTLSWMRAHYVGRPRDLHGARAVARPVPRHPNGPRLPVVARLCGPRTHRIVAVTITLHGIGRKAVASNVLYFVAKAPRGWVVWRQG
jgi:hypothetical protein